MRHFINYVRVRVPETAPEVKREPPASTSSDGLASSQVSRYKYLILYVKVTAYVGIFVSFVTVFMNFLGYFFLQLFFLYVVIAEIEVISNDPCFQMMYLMTFFVLNLPEFKAEEPPERGRSVCSLF